MTVNKTDVGDHHGWPIVPKGRRRPKGKGGDNR